MSIIILKGLTYGQQVSGTLLEEISGEEIDKGHIQYF